MKYLITGLGNIGEEYRNTRHNIGFTVLDALAKASNLVFTDGRYGATATLSLKGRQLILLKVEMQCATGCRKKTFRWKMC